MSSQPKTVTYREARPEDSSRIVHFQIAMAWETEKMKLDHDVVTQGVAEVFHNPHRGKYFVAELTDPTTGQTKIISSLLTVPEWSDWRNGEVWWIHSLYVEAEHRGQGVYKSLYEYLKKSAQQEKNVRGFRLYVDKANAAAQAVYKKLGMTDEHYSLFEWMIPREAVPFGS